MATTEQIQMPALGESGEPCASCGSPLASDQRYCLECGTRRGGPRIPFPEQLSALGGSNSAAPPPGGAAAREPSPLGAVLAISVLGVMLLIGVLIGRGGDGGESGTPVVTVEGAGTQTADSGGEDSTETASTGNQGQAENGGSASAGSDGGGGGAGGGGGGSEETIQSSGGGLASGEAAGAGAGETVEASTEDLEALEDTSGADYQEQLEALPDTIQTPGEPAETDNEEPGQGAVDGPQTFD